MMKERNRKMINLAKAIACVMAISACSNTAVVDTTTVTTETTVLADIIEVKKPEYDENDAYSDWTIDNQITLNGDTIAVSGSGVSAEGSTAVISTGGTYVVSGVLTDGQIKVSADKEDVVRIVLNGVNITSSKTSPIYVEQAEKVIITLADGSENVITDGVEYVFADSEETEPDATLFSKDDLTLNGNGSLTINANYKDALKTKDSLVIMSGIYNINSADDGISGKDSVTIKNGTFSITAKGDGIKTTETDADKGSLTVEDGIFNITAENDGIQSENTLYLIDGEYNITTGVGGDKVVEANGFGGGMPMGGRGPGGMRAPDRMPNGERPDRGGRGGMTPPQMQNGERPQGEMGTLPQMPNGERPQGENKTPPQMPNGENPQGEMMPPDMQAVETSSAETEEESKKALKSGNNITVAGGTFNISAEDDAVHSDYFAQITGGTLAIKSSDDGIHAENRVLVSGGNIDIANSYEGIEAMEIIFNGGNTHLTASDDGLNASDGSGETMQRMDNCVITINDGYVYINSGNDGIDSNGDAIMNGGTVIVDGPERGGEGALDYNGSYYMNGGTLLAAGSSGMAQNVSSESKQAGILVTLPSGQSGGALVTVTDKNGKEIISFAPSKSYQTVVISTPEIKKGKSYKIYTGATHSGKAVDGLYSEGSYTGGNELVSFELTDTASNVSQSGVTVSTGGMPHHMGR